MPATRRIQGARPEALFQPPPERQPLAARMRPRNLSEVVGQTHILKPGSLLPRLVAQNRFGSLLFYGPPGCGEAFSNGQIHSAA